jgi:D-glycero-D-manno-heptose 1,7-bisphosphate phosphatase
VHRAAFLDRDGTLIHDAEYLDAPEKVRVLPGAASAIRLLNANGVLAVVVTNQSAVARGLVTEAVLETIHERMRAVLAAEGAYLDDLLYCPHLPEGVVAPYARTCACRKPEPGMILEAARRHQVDLARSVVIGDALRDIEAGRRAGCRTVLLRRPGREEADGPAARADHVADGLLPAVLWYLTLGL